MIITITIEIVIYLKFTRLSWERKIKLYLMHKPVLRLWIKGHFTIKKIKKIGYGYACHVHNCDKIKPSISRAEGERLLQIKLCSFENYMEKFTPELNADCLMPWCPSTFNLCCETLSSSQLLKHIKGKRLKSSANEFEKYVHEGISCQV